MLDQTWAKWTLPPEFPKQPSSEILDPSVVFLRFLTYFTMQLLSHHV